MLAKKLSSRDTLLSAALDAFGRHGFDSASTRDIAKAAGMPMSQITYHFGGKDGLYLACAQMIADHMGALMGETLAAIEAALAASPDRQTARACISQLLSGLAVAMLDPAMLPYSRFIVREQAEPTRAFDILYSGMMGRILVAMEQMVARISGQTGQATRLMAMAMLGQLLAFRVAQASVLAFTGWASVGPDEVAAIRATLLFNVEAICDRLEKGPCP